MDAAYNNSRLTLTLIRESDQQPIIWTDLAYRPYLLTDRQTTDNTVKKQDLFTQQERTLTRVTYTKTRPRTVKGWELDLDPALGYAYDKGLRFGLTHQFQDNTWTPHAPLSPSQESHFNTLFPNANSKDTLKHSILRNAYAYATQPIPKIPARTLGLTDSDSSEEEYYKAWTLSRLANLPLTRTYRSHNVSEWIRSILHTYYRTHNILIPNTEELRLGSTKKSVTGALTITPESGTYFNMVVLDFESLYPGIIDQYNLSYETVKCPHTECQGNIVPGLDYHICTRRRGIYSAIIGSLRDLRIRHFKPLTKTLPHDSEDYKIAKAATAILKLFLVSSYGVTIRIHGLASPLLGEAITAYGRHVLQTTFDMAKDKGLRPKYGDTDSVFLDNPTEQDVKQFIQQVQGKFGLELAHDRQYAVCVLSTAMKAYFGILPDGRPEIKGLTVAKSNSPRFFLNTFQDCLTALSQGRGSPEAFEQAKQQVRTVVKEAFDRLRRGQIPVEDLEYKVEIREDPVAESKAKTMPQPYQAAQLLREKGTRISRGDTVGFVKVHPFKHQGRTFTVKPLSQTRSIEVNAEDYVRNLTSSLSQTLEPMGIKLVTRADTSLSEFTEPNEKQ